MAVTALLMFSGANRLRYQLTQDGAAGTTLTIPCAGGATPDLVTDSSPGALKAIAKAQANGYGTFGPALSQAEARALWLSDWTGATPGNINTLTAICRLTVREGATPGWLVDAAADGALSITATAAASVAYLDVEIPNMKGA